MLGPILTILIAAGVGAALGFFPEATDRARGPMRTFAVVAALTVVATHLLPHTVAELGWLGLGAAIASFGVLALLGRATPAGCGAEACGHGHASREAGFEAALVGLLLHRLADGVALGGVDGRGIGVLFALGTHEVPITAFVVIASLPRGRNIAAARLALLVGASLVGVGLTHVAGPWMHGASPWMDALVAGTLLQLVARETLGRNHGAAPGGPREWAAGAAGWLVSSFNTVLPNLFPAALAGLAADSGHEHGQHAQADATFVHAAFALAPWVLLISLALVALRNWMAYRPRAGSATVDPSCATQ